MTKYLIDTNSLLDDPSLLESYDVVIPSHVLRELENLELVRKSDRGLQAQIRRAKRFMESSNSTYVDLKDYKFDLRDDWDADYVDNILVQIVVENGYGIITNDRLLKEKCKLYNIEILGTDENSEFDENKGFQTISMSQEEIKEIYKHLDDNKYDLIVNEYLIVYDDFAEEDIILDIFKWDGYSMISMPRNQHGEIHLSFQSQTFDRFVPRDAQQMIAVDSILSNQITQIRGKAGSGKSMIALETAWHLIEREGKEDGYERMVIFTNPVPSRDAQELGFYKGDKLEKLLQSSLGAMLISKFGDEFEILRQIEEGRLDILPLVDIRGYETGEKKTILWIAESQNITTDLMKLSLQRVSENTKVIIDGDYHQQVDRDVYNRDNGMRRVSEVFRGESVFGEIELQNVYRSHIASIADKM